MFLGKFAAEVLIFRSSRSPLFFKMDVLKNFATFTVKHLCWPMQAFFDRTPRVAASGFSRQQILFFSAEPGTYCWKSHRLFLRISLCFGNFTGKQLCWSLFLIELQAFRPVALLKKTPTQMFSCGIHKIVNSS